MKLLVLDGNSIVNRAFYGIRLLTNKKGQYTNAIYGFLNILNKLEIENEPDEIAIAFDLRAPTFRHKMYDGYKAQRKGMPEELAQQMPILKELLTKLGYKIISSEGWEADDILGTLSYEWTKRGDDTLLATGDRDSFQLINEQVSVLLATTKNGQSMTLVMDEDAIFEKYGVKPRDLIEVKALMGDTSDNIPGAKGIGEKTALSLIQKFGTTENLYENIEDPFIKKGAREKLKIDKENVLMSKELATIALNAPVPTDEGAYKKCCENPSDAIAMLRDLEMYTMIDKLNLKETEQLNFFDLDTLPLVTVEATPLEKITGKVFVYKENDTWIVVKDMEVFTASEDSNEFLSLLSDSSCKKYVFDSKPLYAICYTNDIKCENIVFDAKLAAYLLNPSASAYTVENLGAEYSADKNFQCEYVGAGYIENLCEKLETLCKEQEMYSLLADIEEPLAKVLAQMEQIGVALDSDALRVFGNELQELLNKKLEVIYDIVGYEFNVNSPKQLGKALFEDMGLPTRKKTKSGFSTNAETLESLRQYSPVIDHILQYRTYQKLNSTYVEGLLKVVKGDGRIHSTFNQTETRTGRISSEEPNVQNIPVRTTIGSQLRKFFVAKENHVLLDADYSQIELRILAHISGDETMIKAFNDGEDIHQSTAAKIHNMPIEMITPALRSSAKAVNFGIVYGIGAFSLAKDINVTVKEADTFIKNYLENFSKVKKYMEDTIAFGTENGYVTTMYGRRRLLPELNMSNKNIKALGERMAMNTPIQGTAADIIKLAMVKVSQRLESENLKAKLVLQVHDELIVECPIDEIEKASLILGEEMENAASLAVKLKADVSVGKTWYEAKA